MILTYLYSARQYPLHHNPHAYGFNPLRKMAKWNQMLTHYPAK